MHKIAMSGLVGQTVAEFPKDEFSALVHRLPAYGRLAWALARDPRLSRARRAAVLAAAGYVVSPIDFIPGFVPVLGQLDDLAVALVAIRFALYGLKADVRAERLAAAGLSQADLDADLRATGAITMWLARTGFRAGREIASVALKVGAGASRRLIDGGLAFRRRRIEARA